MAPKKTLSNWLNNRYLLIIRNEENFADKHSVAFTYARVVLIGVSLFLLLMTGALFLARTLLAQWFDPLFEQMEVNRQIIELATAVDSLELEVARKDVFINNIKAIVHGEDSLEADFREEMTISGEQKLQEANREDLTYKAATVDSQFRMEYEQLDQTAITIRSSNDQMPELFFITPLNGIVSSPFDNRLGHYGVDVVAKTNEPVKSVADGTVIFASWTMDSGYVIYIQHRNNLISVYKHNSALLKKVGNFVNAGEIVSIIGNSGELSNGPHLHFELWYNGNPVNPEDFVSF